VKAVSDLPEYDEEKFFLEIRILDTVWVLVEEIDEESAGVYHLSGYPKEDESEFREMLSIADGMFGLPLDCPIDEIRFSEIPN